MRKYHSLIIAILCSIVYLHACFGFLCKCAKNLRKSPAVFAKPRKLHKKPPWSHLFDEQVEPAPVGEPWHKLSKDIVNGERWPRLTVKKSHLQIYAAVVDDYKNQVICIASSTLPVLSTVLGTVPTKDPNKHRNKGNTVKAAYEVGKHIGRLALKKGVTKVYFDRAGYKYHGRVEAVAVGARKVGLEL